MKTLTLIMFTLAASVAFGQSQSIKIIIDGSESDTLYMKKEFYAEVKNCNCKEVSFSCAPSTLIMTAPCKFTIKPYGRGDMKFSVSFLRNHKVKHIAEKTFVIR